jgi:DNA-binding NarL/FixJ family response regulator
MPKVRVLLADDHTLVAEGLKSLLKDPFDLVGVVHDGRALLESALKLRPDVIVTDISMPLLNGLEAVRQIRAQRPETRIIILTMHRDTHLAAEAFRAGVSGYLLKVSPGEELVKAIREVAQGRSYVTTLLAKDLINLLMDSGAAPRENGSPLTPRQREVLQLIAEGRTMKEVAGLLKISTRTAESHKYDIMQALSVKTTAELVQCAVRMKMVGE